METTWRLNSFVGETLKIDIGIEDPNDGSWDMAVFREHVGICDICKCGFGRVPGLFGSISSPKKATASRENGKMGGRPRVKEVVLLHPAHIPS